MQAAVYRRYGSPDVVQLEELPKPVPKEREVLIRIRASTVSSGDWRARSLEVPAGFGWLARPVFGLRGPRKPVLGTELAGEIEAVGSGVRKFAVGDLVFAFPGFEMGCHAEYRTMHEDGRLLRMPAEIGFEEAAAISFGGSTALHFLRDLAKLQAGERVLILGASGAVGSAAVQLAKHFFGAEVSAVCSTPNLARVRDLGADRTLDYTRGSFLEPGVDYDVIFDTVGATSFAHCRSALKPHGRLVMCAASLPQILAASWASRTGKQRVIAGNAPERLEDLATLRDLVERGQFRPLIDRAYPLAQITDAHAYVQTGRKRGSVVVQMPA